MSGFRAGHHLFVILNADENPQITQTTQIKEKQEAGAVGKRQERQQWAVESAWVIGEKAP